MAACSGYDNGDTYSGLERREQLLQFVEARSVSHPPDLRSVPRSAGDGAARLEALEGEGKLRRFHGGALAVQSAPRNRRLPSALASRPKRSVALGRAAAALGARRR